MKSDFFMSNRKRLAGSASSQLIIMTGYTAMQWQSDSAVPFRQEANFWYLTGIERPDWWLIVDAKKGDEWLVRPDNDEVQQIFDGSLSANQASLISGVKNVISQSEADNLLQNLANHNSVVGTIGRLPFEARVDFTLNPAPAKMRRRLAKYFDKVEDIQDTLSKMRAIKQSVEIEAMERAAELSVEAFEAAKNKLSTSQHEYEIEAELTYAFRKADATHAFEPIVAGGKNACTLHYVDNSSQLKLGDMVLIDAGARLGGYPIDITRTYAVGEVTQRYGDIHFATQQALHKISELIKPGVSISEYLDSVDAIMKDALVSLGLMKNHKDELAYRKYFPHLVSHGIGIDVHENLGGHKEFQPGMTLTVEPGIYIPEEGIGVRIEDTILVTGSGYKSFTANLSTDL